MKMAMVVHAYYPHDVRVRRQCEALAERGDEVDLVCLQQEGEEARERVGNVNVHRMPVRHVRGQGPLGYILEYARFFVAAFARLTRLSIRHRYPVVQVHNMPDVLVFVTLIPKLLGARILLDMHDVTPELYQSLYGIRENSTLFRLLVLAEQMSLAYADAVLTVNRNIRDLFILRNPIAHKIEVVMNAPDPRYFHSDGSGAPPPNGSFRLFHHGQILRRYNFESTLDAVAIALRDVPELQLDVYGDGEEAYLDALRRKVQADGLQNVVRFHDRVPVEQVPGLIRNAHLGLVPCRRDPFVDKVMLPVRLLEYVAMELPSVVTEVGTVRSYFGPDDVAYVAPDDAEGMAESIVTLYRNPQKRRDMAHKARRSFRSLEWPRMKQRYFRVLDRLVAGN